MSDRTRPSEFCAALPDGTFSDVDIHSDILGEDLAPLVERRARRVAKAAAPRTLYVKRRLANAEEVREHFRAQGLSSALPAQDMHATIAFSREPVDWSLIEVLTHDLVVAGGKRAMHQFPPRSTPNGALVLKFESAGLERRWAELRDAGASWDFPEYQPHITITYSVPKADVDAVEPYRGPLVFGSEEHAEVNEDWAIEINEEPL